MLHYAAFFFVLAILSGLFGFGAVVSDAADIAKGLFWIFIVAAGLSLIMGKVNR